MRDAHVARRENIKIKGRKREEKRKEGGEEEEKEGGGGSWWMFEKDGLTN